MFTTRNSSVVFWHMCRKNEANLNQIIVFLLLRLVSWLRELFTFNSLLWIEWLSIDNQKKYKERAF